jgi:putative SOS response-associated peptidase YedK
MCGKFTALASWSEVVAFTQPLIKDGDGGGDEVVTFRPMSALPVIILHPETKERAVVRMRWGFPHRADPNRPGLIHARSETIDELPTFKDVFLNGQRGIVVMRTFNEGLELPSGKTEQWTINPGDGVPRGFAFLWRRFEIGGLPAPLLACVMATVPASELVSPITDRMPAILEDADWAKWLGEEAASPAEVKAVLKTMEGVGWEIAKEAKAPRRPRR